MKLRVPMSPHVNIKNLIKILFFFQVKQDILNIIPQDKARGFYGNGSQGLAILLDKARAQLNLQQYQKITIYIPDYFCQTVFDYLDTRFIDCILYPINKMLEPDWENLESLAINKSPNIFLLVHYFGFQNDIQGCIQFCKRHDCQFIEDGAHVLKPYDDMYLFSWGGFTCPYKHLGLPQMGIAFLNSSHEQLNDIVEKNSTLKFFIWVIKKIILLVLNKLRLLWPSNLPTTYNQNENSSVSWVREKLNIRQPCDMSKKLLFYESREIETYCKIRRRYYQKIEQAMMPYYFVYLKRLTSQVVPYGAVLFMPQILASRCYAILIKKGYPVQSWPNLPKAIYSKNHKHRVAMELRKTNLILPIHHDITFKDVNQMIANLIIIFDEHISRKKF